MDIKVKSCTLARGSSGRSLSRFRLGVFLLPPGWDACPLQGYPSIKFACAHLSTSADALWQLSVLPKNTAQCPRPGLEPRLLDPEMSALTMRPPRPGEVLPCPSPVRQFSCSRVISWCNVLLLSFHCFIDYIAPVYMLPSIYFFVVITFDFSIKGTIKTRLDSLSLLYSLQ